MSRRRSAERLRRELLAVLLAMIAPGCGEQTVELFGDGGARDASSEDSMGIDLSLRDPENCGVEGRDCEDDEYCVAGACVCRPPLTRIGEDCVDTSANASLCGATPIPCPMICLDGVCAGMCPAGRTECNGGCVDIRSHPLHCGECGRPCGSDKVCIFGQCENFEAGACLMCPCAACDSRSCCTYPSFPMDVICVDAAGCPET